MLKNNRNYKKDIKDVNRMSKKIPTLMEAINFRSDREREMYEGDEDFEMEDEIPMGKPQMKQSPEMGGDANVENFIANMRKESLGIMKALSDNPDDAVYQFAKKIFQLADKAHEDQKEGKDINGQPKNGMGERPERPM